MRWVSGQWLAINGMPTRPPLHCRVHTLSVPVVSELAEMYKSADHTGMCCLMAKLAVEKTLHSKLEDTRTFVHAKVRCAERGGWAGLGWAGLGWGDIHVHWSALSSKQLVAMLRTICTRPHTPPFPCLSPQTRHAQEPRQPRAHLAASQPPPQDPLAS